MSKKIKLTYFNVRGKAELIRYILVASDVDFEDKRIVFTDWPKIKPTIPSGQLPLVELPCGTQLNESQAIARYFARKHNLAGSGDMDTYKVDRATCTLDDLLTAVINIFHENDPARKENMKKDLHEVKLPSILKRLTNYLNESKGDFFLGNQVSYADLYLVNILEYFESEYQDYPKIVNCRQKVLDKFPKLVKYRASRPVPEADL